MKEVFYSEKLKKYFDVKEECIAAEEEAKNKENALKEKAAQASKEKRELAKTVEDADAKLTEAYNNYEVKQAEAKKLLEEYRKKVDDIIEPAKDEIKRAQRARYEAIKEFSSKYGSYSVSYTGNKAYNEFMRLSSFFNDIFNF